MRRALAASCCVVYLAFGFVADAAHVHEAADHHEEMRGLHLDHAHFGESSDHPSEDPDGGAGHVGHHDGDALDLTVTAQRLPDPGPRVLPAVVAVGPTIGVRVSARACRHQLPVSWRGPPRYGPIPPRAPPA